VKYFVFAKQKIPKSYWKALDGGTQSIFIRESAVVFLFLELGARSLQQLLFSGKLTESFINNIYF